MGKMERTPTGDYSSVWVSASVLMKTSLSAGPSTDTSLSGYATKRNHYPATLLKEAGACLPKGSVAWPNATTITVQQQAN